MKRLFTIIIGAAVAMSLLTACGGKTQEQKAEEEALEKAKEAGVVLVDSLITKDVAGITLGETYTVKTLKRDLEKFLKKTLYSQNLGDEGGYTRIIIQAGYAKKISFGGQVWDYIDLYLDPREGKLAIISFTNSADDYEPLNAAYYSIKSSLGHKYGEAIEKANDVEYKNKQCNWIDRSTSVGITLTINESITRGGDTRTFCNLTYHDLLLEQEVEARAMSDL